MGGNGREGTVDTEQARVADTNATMMGCAAMLAALLLAVVAFEAEAFARPPPAADRRRQQRPIIASAPSTTAVRMADAASEVTQATLTADTTWRLRLLLNGVTTANGRKLEGQLFVVEGQFIEEEG